MANLAENTGMKTQEEVTGPEFLSKELIEKFRTTISELCEIGVFNLEKKGIDLNKYPWTEEDCIAIGVFDLEKKGIDLNKDPWTEEDCIAIGEILLTEIKYSPKDSKLLSLLSFYLIDTEAEYESIKVLFRKISDKLNLQVRFLSEQINEIMELIKANLTNDHQRSPLDGRGMVYSASVNFNVIKELLIPLSVLFNQEDYPSREDAGYEIANLRQSLERMPDKKEQIIRYIAKLQQILDGEITLPMAKPE